MALQLEPCQVQRSIYQNQQIMQLLCPNHKQPVVYVCRSLACDKKQLICCHQDCLMAHCHGVELSMYPIQFIQSEVKARQSFDQKRMESSKQKLKTIFKEVREEVMAQTSKKGNNYQILDKITLQIGDLNQQLSQNIQYVENQEFEKVTKGMLIKLCKQFLGFDSGTRDHQLNQLEKEVVKKTKKLEQSIRALRESPQFKTVFKVPIFNRSKQLRKNRFDTDTSSWSFSSGKIDAISFQSSEQISLCGFIHFPVIEFPANGVKLKVTLYTNNEVVYTQEKTFDRETAFEKQFYFEFEQPQQILAQVKYELASQNAGEYFQARHGGGSHDVADEIRFSRSSKDNNSTSETTGQFKALMIYGKS